jgi:hypothetical protein
VRQAQILTRLKEVNPRNTQWIPVYPVKCETYLIGVVKVFIFFDLEQN